MVNGSHWKAVGPAGTGFETNPATFSLGALFAGSFAGVVATCESSGGDGVTGTGTGQQSAGIRGISVTEHGNGVIAEAHNGAQAYALWARSNSGSAGHFDGKVYVNGDLQVTGTKAAVIRSGDGSSRLLYAVEAPESWFEDFGFGRLVDGRAQVTLDPDFVAATEDGPYHVFLTEYEAGSGLHVTDRTPTGFGVRAAVGSARSEFSYRVVARRGDVRSERFAVVRETDAKKAEPEQPGSY
ncbi:hypothetical protein [Streptomyces sp. CB03911]|uniref:hypothetical protein n=1 Tax=Streptomycetaceae TaxID=2062 RepID=UPI0009392FBB|nr:hypothetical protein [Streptomyces sp. CB03911]OKI13291.1 hypothetical protein A6A07_15415 [Streptomyces sp. CB03911]